MVFRKGLISGAAVLALALAVALAPAVTWAQQRPASAWPWPDSMDAVQAAPKNHKVLYEDENVRILSVTVQPGEKENQHFHRWPSVLIFDSYPKLQNTTWDGKTLLRNGLGPKDAFPVVISMPPQGPHSIEDLGSSPVHIYRVEFKKLQFKNVDSGGGFKTKTPQ
jgi:quercetin dioxygenase-like cupin family protein